jgi:hypothetical protein
MNLEWQAFLDSVPWYLTAGQLARAGVTQPPGSWNPASREFTQLFPQLARLLSAARTTEVFIDDRRLSLFTWEGAESGLRSWLCPQPSSAPSPSLLPAHQILLCSFGGIIERANEPSDTWLLNHDDALTEAQAATDAAFIKDYHWAFEQAGVAIPIELRMYYPIAWEANGNCTLCHRRSGAILLFATDHNFRHIRRLAGCPDYTLYQIDGAVDFSQWVNEVADQWLNAA